MTIIFGILAVVFLVFLYDMIIRILGDGQMKSHQWYARRLAKYCNDKYGEYDDSIEWFVDPAPNKWLIYIPELNRKVEMTCDDLGNVTEVQN